MTPVHHGAALPSPDGEGRAVRASGGGGAGAGDPSAGDGPVGREDARILTPRLRLAPVTGADEAELFALHSDPRAFVEDSTAPLTDPTQMRWVLAQWRESWARRGLGHLTVRAREERSARTPDDLPAGLLGVVGLVPLTGGDGAQGRGEGAGAEVLSAYWRLAPHATGRGIAVEAMRAVLARERGQRADGVTRPPDAAAPRGASPEIVAITARGNAPSRRLAARLGFRPAPAERPVPGGRAGDVLLVLPQEAAPGTSSPAGTSLD